MVELQAAELQNRIASLQQVLKSRDIDWAIINANADLYYFTGSAQPLYLFVAAEGKPFIMARKGISRIVEEVFHILLESFSSSKEITDILAKYGIQQAKKIGLTMDAIAYGTVLRLQKNLGSAQLEDISSIIRMLRMVKSETEIDIQRRAADIESRLPEVVRECFRPGMTELELSAMLENFFRLNGHTTILRSRREGVEVAGYGICSCGPRSLAGTKFEGICGGQGMSAAVPYGASTLPILRHEAVILDYAFNLEGYHVDQTRMFSWGAPSQECVAAYEAMVKIEDAIERELRPGSGCDAIYQMSLAMAKEFGYEAEYMGAGQENVRFVGHGVGLELDELPLLAAEVEGTLCAGMVIAVEPKVALPGVGVVGIEDTYVVREDGPQRLTHCSKEIIVIE